MKMFRKRASRRVTASFLLLTFVQSIFFPSISWALTAGQHQPEFTSYEEPGSSDMVNLLTGDFNLNLPLLEVPGPEGGFSVPLSYHAGIGPEQEASWTGLGWNINVGSIVRNINQFPDDASGEPNAVHVQDLTGIRGYDTDVMGVFHQGWNSVTGKYGNINLLDVIDVEWGSTSSVGIVGFHVGDGFSVRPMEFINGVIAAVSLGAAAAVEKTYMAAAKQAAIQIGANALIGAIGQSLSSGTSSSTITTGHWNYSYASQKVRKNLFAYKTSWKIWLDQTRDENMYGVLYAGLAPTQMVKTTEGVTTVQGQNITVGLRLKLYGSALSTVPSFLQSTGTTNSGAASDINFTLDDSKAYQDQITPALLAADQFSVNAPGISGAITPYRLDIGSVSMPREMTEKHTRLAPIPYLNYKVPFIYEGMPANRYLHHTGSIGSSPSETTPTFTYGMQLTDALYVQKSGSSIYYRFAEYDLQDYIFSTGRVRDDVSTSKKFAQGNYVEWLSNSEIKATTTYPSGYMDFLPGGPSSARNSFRDGASLNGIGGYAITSVNGQTYHFALPVYAFNEKTESIKVADQNQSSSIIRNAPFATTWLLTAITGPDFVDRNSNGMVDDDDWGFWMKFNYGKYSDSYDWRQPYTGYFLDETGTYKNAMSGQKQLYYLNSIESRSHVALFMKSSRQDGYSAAGTNIVPLKLDEIALLKKEHYKNLVSTFGLTDFSAGISSVCLSSQFTTMRDFINKNTIKRVVFNYGYNLCMNTPNALSSGGKLTLNSLSVRGRNDVKLFPDYLFQYADNPNYNINYWDGWGMYNATGTSATNTHGADQTAINNGTAWSLTNMTTPMGSDLTINYERDDYSSISGNDILGASYSFTQATPSSPVTKTAHVSDFATVNINHGGQLAPGDKVKIAGHVGYQCGNDPLSLSVDYEGDYVISSTTPTSINVAADYRNIENCNGPLGGQITLSSDYGNVYKVFPNRKGGDLRVASLVVNDQGATYKTRYQYNNVDGTSSGVVTQEPAFVKITELPFYKYLNYPSSPVMYGRVTVLGGNLSTDSDYTSKQVYEFEAPNLSNYSQVQTDVSSYPDISDGYLTKIEDRTSKTGRLNKVTLYDKSGSVVSQSQLQYTDQMTNNQDAANQGVFSQGTLLYEMFNSDGRTLIGGGTSFDYEFIADRSHLNRTTRIKYPNSLQKIINTKDGFSSESENLKWDFTSGLLVEDIKRSAQGINVKTVNQLAYRQTPYVSMGPKANSIGSKNMLSQIAATYTYRTDAAGTPFGLIDAIAYTWKNDWSNYTNYDTSIPGYKESVDGANVWRISKTNVWMGDYTKLRSDGTQTFTSSNLFDFTSGATNAGWKWTDEVVKFDHYSMPVQSRDLTDIHAAVKMGYNNSVKIAVADNAKYNEIAFSGAEDLQSDKPYFGSEVAKGNGTVVRVSKGDPVSVHTGDAALSLSTGYGFVFKSSGIEVKTYRASVWANSTNGRIYYKINGVEQTSPAPTIQVGSWYQINVEIPVAAVPSTFEVGVKSSSGTVIFDDFRFQPRDASMTCYVYNPSDYDYTQLPAGYQPEYSYVLDNDNLFMKYEYNERGVLVKTYKESIKYNGVKLLSETKDNFRRGN